MTNTLISAEDEYIITKPTTPTDEVAVRSLYQQLLDGWDAGSGKAFAAPFADDSDLIGFDGTHLKGRHEIAKFHQQLFDTFVKGSRLVGKIRNLHFLTADVALMHVIGGTVMEGQTGIDPERNSVQTIVATKNNKESGVWPHFKIQELNTWKDQRRLMC